MNQISRFTLLALLVTVAVSAHAQSGVVQAGCANSPENPTAILGLVGGGGFALAVLRDRWRARRSK